MEDLPGLYDTSRHTDVYFPGLSPSRTLWRLSCWEKSNFIFVYEFKYGQAWKIWPSPLRLSRYNTVELSNKWYLELLVCPVEVSPAELVSFLKKSFSMVWAHSSLKLVPLKKKKGKNKEFWEDACDLTL